MTQVEYTSNDHAKKVFSMLAEEGLKKVTGGFISVVVWAIGRSCRYCCRIKQSK